MQRYAEFLYTNNKLSEIETLKSNIICNCVKGISIPQHKFNQRVKRLMHWKLEIHWWKKIEEDTHKWKDILYSCVVV